MLGKFSIFLCFLFVNVIYSQDELRLLSSDFNSLVISYRPIYTDTSFIKLNNQTFRSVKINFGVTKQELTAGSPDVQSRIITIGVPSETGNVIEIINSSYKEIDGSIVPVPKVNYDGVTPFFEYSIGDSYFLETEHSLVEFGSSGISRDLIVQNIIINPVKFLPSQSKIRIYKEIIFKVNFAKGNISRQPADEFSSYGVINFDIAKYWNQSNDIVGKSNLTSSVLSTGRWFRFEINEEGFYRITRSQLSSYGIDPNSVDPRTIKIFNNGGKVLPELNSAPRPVDLVENAIIVVGEEDGKFDEGDYILFYGRGTLFFDYDSDGKTITKFYHPYSKSNFYWITSGGARGKRMITKSSLSQVANYLQNSTSAFVAYDEDKINLLKSGRQFVGDNFTAAVNQRTYINKLDHRISSEPIKYSLRFVVNSATNLTLNVSENGNQLLNDLLFGYGNQKYTVGTEYFRNFVYQGNLPDNRSVLTFRITPSAQTSVGYLDYFTIEYKRELKPTDDNLLVFSDQVNGVVEYLLTGFSSTNFKVFDITDHSNVRVVDNFIQLSGGQCRFQFLESANRRSKYYAVELSKLKSPSNPVEVPNQNLRGEQVGAKFIIITSKEKLEAANKLKVYRETQTTPPISTIVVDVQKIYNEFSGGLLDVTAIRDYIKYAYENWQVRPEYVLLLGKGTYDYKNIEGANDNIIPTWQTEESLSYVYSFNDSYTTDDYFAAVSGDDTIVDLAIGRVPSRNLTEANNFINKVIAYEKSKDFGPWRNLVTLLADDGINTGSDDGPIHTAACERLANFHFPKFLDFNKIYLASYPPVITSTGRRKPAVNDALVKSINDGTLFLNFVGHGNPEVWTYEIVFEKSVTIPLLKNRRLFFLTAATCDFGYYDIPNYQSGTEQLILLKEFGSIGALTSSRLVFSGQNEAMNQAWVNILFNSARDTLNLPITLGKALFNLKKTYYTVNDKKYHLFGDPTLRLNIPVLGAKIDSINGSDLSSPVQLKAMGNVRVLGRVVNHYNITNQEFNGEGLLTVFDSERLVFLSEINLNMTVQNSIIFRGRVSVRNGIFVAEFNVPKDISYENKNGKINFYFFNDQTDGIVFTSNVIVGGTDSSVVNDGKGPVIDIFFDDENYQNSFLVGSNPTLIIKLFDETGLNTTGTGIGHKLEGILNEQMNNPIDFTNYFVGDLDAGGKSGKVNYRFNNLSNGEYSVQVKAWDIFNNFSTEKTFFSVVGDNNLVVRDVFNYPNPFSSSTTFTFQQNLMTPLNVKIKIYTVAGRLIKTIEKFNINQRYVIIDWDGRDNDGNELANGTYLYKLIVSTTDGSFKKDILGKLAKLK
jgi:hypothetical protein